MVSFIFAVSKGVFTFAVCAKACMSTHTPAGLKGDTCVFCEVIVCLPLCLLYMRTLWVWVDSVSKAMHQHTLAESRDVYTLCEQFKHGWESNPCLLNTKEKVIVCLLTTAVVLCCAGGHAGVGKEIMRLCGVDLGPPRLPLLPLPSDQATQLHSSLRQLGFFDWI